MHGLDEKAEDMVEMGAQSCIGFIKKCSKIGYVVVKSTEDPFLLLPECVAIEKNASFNVPSGWSLWHWDLTVEFNHLSPLKRGSFFKMFYFIICTVEIYRKLF